MKWIAWIVLLVSTLNARDHIRHEQYPITLNNASEFQTPATIFTGIGGTSTADLTSPFTGTQSNKFTVGNASTVIFQQVFTAKNICSDSFVEIVLRFPNKNNVLNLARMDVYLLTDASNFKNGEVWGALSSRDSLSNYWGYWQYYRIPIKMLTGATGTYNCASVTSIALGLRAQPTFQDTVSVARFSTYPPIRTKGALIITVDDQWDVFRVNGGPKLDSLCFDYTMFINPGLFGGSKSTLAQVDSMYFRSVCSRPEAAPHTMRHDSVTDLTSDSLIRDIQENQEFIYSHGWTRRGQSCVDCFALPYGKKDRRTDSVLRASGIISYNRLSKGSAGYAQKINDPMAATSYIATGNTIDSATAKTAIDSLVYFKTVGVVIVHKIGAVGCTEDVNTWCKPNWLALMNYAKVKVDAGQLEVLSLGDYLRPYGVGYRPVRRVGRR